MIHKAVVAVTLCTVLLMAWVDSTSLRGNFREAGQFQSQTY